MTKPRPHLRPDGIPTRSDITLQTDAEFAITQAMWSVESAGGSPALTEAVTLLGKARDRVADHVEGICPGHVASETDAKVCGRCGVHIDDLRPDEDSAK